MQAHTEECSVQTHGEDAIRQLGMRQLGTTPWMITPCWTSASSLGENGLLCCILQSVALCSLSPGKLTQWLVLPHCTVMGLFVLTS